MEDRSRRFCCVHKAFSDYLPQCGVMSCLGARDILPSRGARITFTRNRTRGSDFPPFSLPHRRSQPLFSVAFARISGNGEGPALRDRTGTISREAAMFLLSSSACVTGRTACASDLLGRGDMGNGSTSCVYCCHWHADAVSLPSLLPRKSGRLEGGHTVMPQRFSPSLSGPARAAQDLAPRYQQASPAQKTLLLDSFVEWTGYTRKYAIGLLNHGEQDQQHPAPSFAPVPSSGATGALSGLEGDTLCVCQTAPAVIAHAGGVAGTARASAASRKKSVASCSP